jgi:hypothetical protein
MSAPPFPTISSNLKARCEGEFVRRLKLIPGLRKNFPRINPQYLNEACVVPRIAVVAAPGPRYAVQGEIYRVNMTIAIELPDPPESTEQDNAKLLESAEGSVQGVIETALAEGSFGVIPGSWSERKTSNQRHRVFSFTVITA